MEWERAREEGALLFVRENWPCDWWGHGMSARVGTIGVKEMKEGEEWLGKKKHLW